DPIGRFTEWLGDFRQGLAALGKIVALLEAPNAIVEQPAAVELPREGKLILRDVTFGYRSSRPVVRGVSLALEPGEHVALVGSADASGSRRFRTGPIPTCRRAVCACPPATGSSSGSHAWHWPIRP